MDRQRLPASIFLLMAVQALSLCTAPLYYLTGGIVGSALAPRPDLATLPIACIIIATAGTVLPATRLMQAAGRKRVFIAGALINAIGALVAAAALLQRDFLLFCAAGGLAGVSIAIAQQYRFAAIEVVPPALAARATARVLLAGLLAAWLGPELAVWGGFMENLDWTADALPAQRGFVGGYLLLAVIALLTALLVTIGYRNHRPTESGRPSASRPLREILLDPGLRLAVVAAAMGYAMMSFVMTAAPLSMHGVDGHSMHDTKWVVQSHIIAMFAPSLFSGQLISRLGHRRIIGLGVAIYVLCLAIATAGQHLLHYWWAMVLLGVGWNFLFVGGTALLPECHRPEERFRVQSFNEVTVFGCQAVAALASGWVIHRFGWHTLVWVAAVMVAVLFWGLWQARRGYSQIARE